MSPCSSGGQSVFPSGHMLFKAPIKWAFVYFMCTSETPAMFQIIHYTLTLSHCTLCSRLYDCRTVSLKSRLKPDHKVLQWAEITEQGQNSERTIMEMIREGEEQENTKEEERTRTSKDRRGDDLWLRTGMMGQTWCMTVQDLDWDMTGKDNRW